MGTDNIHHKARKKKDLQRKKPTKEPKAILIICEGQKTEVNYFNSLKEHLRLTNLRIEPSPKPDVEHIISVAKKQKEQGFRAIFCVFDNDHNKNIGGVLSRIRSPLQAIISKPCFEYWILLHFEYTTRCFGGTSPCDDLINNKLKKYLCDYSKNYDFSEVVKKYKTALENAKKSKTEYEKMSDSALSYTDVYLVIEAVMDTQK